MQGFNIMYANSISDKASNNMLLSSYFEFNDMGDRRVCESLPGATYIV